MASRRSAGAVAKTLRTATASRAVKKSDDDLPEVIDDAYFRQLAAQLKKKRWALDDGRCIWCAAKATKVGVLPTVGSVCYCAAHAPKYKSLRQGHGPAGTAKAANPHSRPGDHVIHMRHTGWLGGALCGLEPRHASPKTTTDPSAVTCKRCRKKL